MGPAVVFSSVALLTVLVAALCRFLSWKICPICAGVAATWGWLLVARLLGFEVDSVILGVLMGGSVVGLTDLAAAKLPSGHSKKLLKSLSVILGFLTVYSVVAESWVRALLFLVLWAGAVLACFSWPGRQGQIASGFKKKLQDDVKGCC